MDDNLEELLWETGKGIVFGITMSISSHYFHDTSAIQTTGIGIFSGLSIVGLDYLSNGFKPYIKDYISKKKQKNYSENN